MTNKKINRAITPQVIKLAVAWVNDEITLVDVAQKLGTMHMGHAYTTLARALKEHIKNETH